MWGWVVHMPIFVRRSLDCISLSRKPQRIHLLRKMQGIKYDGAFPDFLWPIGVYANIRVVPAAHKNYEICDTCGTPSLFDGSEALRPIVPGVASREDEIIVERFPSSPFMPSAF